MSDTTNTTLGAAAPVLPPILTPANKEYVTGKIEDAYGIERPEAWAFVSYVDEDIRLAYPNFDQLPQDEQDEINERFEQEIQDIIDNDIIITNEEDSLADRRRDFEPLLNYLDQVDKTLAANPEYMGAYGRATLVNIRGMLKRTLRMEDVA